MTEKARLRRELGLFEVTLSGLAIILGAGIYVLVGKAAGLAGNAVWLSFFISALIALSTGLSYAELASMFPNASAEYEYTRKAFRESIALFIGWLVILSGVVGTSTVALGFAGYFHALTGMQPLLTAMALIAVLSLVAFHGVRESAWFAIVSTLFVVAGLVFVVAVSAPYLGNVSYIEMPHGLHGVFEASALVFFAYIGFEQIVKLSEETKHPERTIPRALLLAIAISAVFYVLIGGVAVSVMGWEGLGRSEAPLADVALIAFKSDTSVLITLTALFATGNTVLLALVTTSRIVYGIAKAGSLPPTLGRLHPTRHTPWPAIICTAAAAILFALLGDIALVAGITNFALFVTFLTVNIVVIFVRFKEPHTSRHFRVPGSISRVPVLPVLGLLFCVFLLFQLPGRVLLIGVVLLSAGAVCCILNRFVRTRQPLTKTEEIGETSHLQSGRSVSS